jgi:U3 small nucleolar RNA-associated protein 3
LEEQQEARRIESKQLEDFTGADAEFEVDVEEADELEGFGIGLSTYAREDKLPEVTILTDASEEDRLAYLRQKYPISGPLSQEFASLHKDFLGLKSAASTGGPVTVTKYQTLATYLGLLSMYFGLLTSVAVESNHLPAMPAEELEKHPILEKIIDLRDAWERIKDLEELPIKQVAPVVEVIPQLKDQVNGTKIKEKKKRSAKDAQKEASLQRRKARLDAIEADLAALNQPYVAPKQSLPSTAPRKEGTLGDEEDLTPAELAEKARRRRNLGFYTSQIVQKATKRGIAGREAGGDVDIPHRERWRDRQARFQAEAEAKRARFSNAADTGAGSDGEYQSLVNRDAAKAAKKKQAREAWETKQAEVAAQYEEEVGTDGKRKLNYQIEKNKGLAPFRKKEARNPRVKKRKKFEEKKKKLGSVRKLYKGGQGGAYGGEMTGIKSGLVRGTRL